MRKYEIEELIKRISEADKKSLEKIDKLIEKSKRINKYIQDIC